MAFYKSFLTIFVFVMLSPSIWGKTDTAQPSSPCDDIRKYDFQNAVIKIERRGVLKFHLGTAYSYDDPYNANVDHADWKNDILLERNINPEPGILHRMIVVSSGHLTGTDSWGTVLIFTCQNGHRLRIFNRQYLGGATPKILQPKIFTITSPDWEKGDASCCPSYEKIESFKWNPARRTYDLFETTRVRIKKD
jgi:hypothetical protein